LRPLLPAACAAAVAGLGCDSRWMPV
jgi:hypothetical protein